MISVNINVCPICRSQPKVLEFKNYSKICCHSVTEGGCSHYIEVVCETLDQAITMWNGDGI